LNSGDSRGRHEARASRPARLLGQLLPRARDRAGIRSSPYRPPSRRGPAGLRPSGRRTWPIARRAAEARLAERSATRKDWLLMGRAWPSTLAWRLDATNRRGTPTARPRPRHPSPGLPASESLPIVLQAEVVVKGLWWVSDQVRVASSGRIWRIRVARGVPGPHRGSRTIRPPGRSSPRTGPSWAISYETARAPLGGRPEALLDRARWPVKNSDRWPGIRLTGRPRKGPMSSGRGRSLRAVAELSRARHAAAPKADRDGPGGTPSSLRPPSPGPIVNRPGPPPRGRPGGAVSLPATEATTKPGLPSSRAGSARAPMGVGDNGRLPPASAVQQAQREPFGLSKRELEVSGS